MNEKNRTHLLRPCAATALLNEISMNNSRARSSAANDEATDSTVARPRHPFPASARIGQVASYTASVVGVDVSESQLVVIEGSVPTGVFGLDFGRRRRPDTNVTLKAARTHKAHVARLFE